MKPTPSVHIAIADDNQVYIKGIKWVIEKIRGFTVTLEALGGNHLIKQLTSSKELPHVCLLDISMPDAGGFEVLPILNRQWKSMHVIMQSSYYDEYNIIKAYREGARGFLPKDADIHTIHAAITAVQTVGYYYPAGINMQTIHDKHYHTDLSELEKEFLQHCASDKTMKEIAKDMNKSIRTVEGYRDNLCAKLRIRHRTGLALFAMKNGIAR